jgi:hypothetical protein
MAMRNERLQKLRLRICRRSGGGRTFNRSHKLGLLTSIQVLCCARAVAAGVEALAVNPSSLAAKQNVMLHLRPHCFIYLKGNLCKSQCK